MVTLILYIHLRILLFHTLAIDEIKIEIALSLESHDLACANSAKFIEENSVDRLAICNRRNDEYKCLWMDGISH